MPVVSAFLVPGSPLPYLRSENPPWAAIASGYRAAARALSASRPDTILLYSTQWMAVLDQLWQTRPALSGTHIDENWYEYGDLDYSVAIDTEHLRRLADADVALLATPGLQIAERRALERHERHVRDKYRLRHFLDLKSQQGAAAALRFALASPATFAAVAQGVAGDKLGSLRQAPQQPSLRYLMPVTDNAEVRK